MGILYWTLIHRVKYLLQYSLHKILQYNRYSDHEVYRYPAIDIMSTHRVASIAGWRYSLCLWALRY